MAKLLQPAVTEHPRKTMHKIFLIDDHPMLLEGLVHVLERRDEFGVCGTAETAAEGLARVPEARPDLVVMDMTLPDKNGLELLKDLGALCPDIPVLVLSMHDEVLYAERVLRAGGRGYIMKETAAIQLVDAITKVLAGGVYLSDKASAHVLSGFAGQGEGRPKSRLDQLTDREFEVFEKIGWGKSVHEIADELHISPRTVDAHRTNIRKKLDLPDAPALMRYAVRWVELGTEEGE